MSDRRLVNLKTVTGLRSGTTDNAQVFQDLIPGSDIVYKLGTSAFRWLYVYAYESVITNNLNVGETINVKDVVISESLTVPYLEVGDITDTIITDFDDTSVALNRNIVAPRIQATSYLVSPFISTMGFTQVDKLYASRSTDTTSTTDVNAALKVDGGIACAKRVWADAFTADTSITTPLINTVSNTVTGNETVAGTLGVTGVATFAGTVKSTNVSDAATSTSITASIQTLGGVSVAKKLFANSISCDTTVGTSTLTTTTINQSGLYASINVTDASTSTSNASIKTAGGVAVAKKLVANSINCDTTVTTVTNTVTGNETVGGTLGVTGATTLSSTLGVTGATTLSSTLGVTGATTLSSTLGVTGATTLNSTLGVTGATTLSSTLAVTGPTTLNYTAGPSLITPAYYYTTLTMTNVTGSSGSLNYAQFGPYVTLFTLPNGLTIASAYGAEYKDITTLPTVARPNISIKGCAYTDEAIPTFRRFTITVSTGAVSLYKSSGVGLLDPNIQFYFTYVIV